jgi:hypothetical protein
MFIDPEPPLSAQYRAVEVWAALSNVLLLLSILLVIVFRPEHWFSVLVGFAVIFGGIESATRRHLTDYILSIIILLAVIAGGILLIEFWRWVVAIALIGVMAYSFVGNVRELRR